MVLSKRISQVGPSMTLAITAKAKKMAREGVDVVNFAAGEPDFDTPEHIKNAAIKAIRDGFTKYTPSSGIEALKEAISQKLKRENSLGYSSPQIVVSCGAKHSLYNVIQAICQEGDEVLIPSPYWVSYPEMVKMSGAKPVYIETRKRDNFKLAEGDLKSKITKNTRALIVNTPSNPTGAVYSKEELDPIARLAAGNNFYVISDEIYENLIYDGKSHISIASLGRGVFEKTMVVNGVSKSYSMTGWRIGYAAGPEEIMKAVACLQSHSTSNPTSISQMAALEAMRGDQSFLAEIRSDFEKRRNYMLTRLATMKKLSCARPEGAFYLFCDISKLKIDSIAASRRILEEAHVAVIPGAPFGDDNFIRLSFATNRENIEKGMDRLEKWVKQNG